MPRPAGRKLDLNALLIFAVVAETSSFSRAARRLQLPVSTVSRRVADLEGHLGLRLLERSTRHLRLTAVGLEILDQARRVAEAEAEVTGIASEQQTEIGGTLRLRAPPSISDSVLAPLLGAFQRQHARVRIEVMVTERPIDFIADGIDLAFVVGAVPDQNLVCRRLLQYRHQLVASPGYLESVEPPRHPRDLPHHRLLAFSHFQPSIRWAFTHVGQGQADVVSVAPQLGINDYVGITARLLAGDGIGDLPPVVQPGLLREGRLVEVLPEWHLPVYELSLVHLAHRHLPRTARTLRTFVAEEIAQLFPDLPT